MTGQWLTDYLGHMQVPASDACSFVEGLDQADFHDDKRTQSAAHRHPNSNEVTPKTC